MDDYDWWIWKGEEGSARGLFKLLSNLPRGTEKKRDKSAYLRLDNRTRDNYSIATFGADVAYFKSLSHNWPGITE